VKPFDKSSSINENIEFLQAFLKNPMKVGAITPSSPELAEEMLRDIKPSPDNIVLELGVGTGAITRHLRKIVPDERSYLGIELDDELAEKLKDEMPEMNIVCGNALEMHDIHANSGLGKVGYIICCLPFVTIPNEINEKILEEVDKFMNDGCLFRTFIYVHGYYMPSAIKIREFMRDRHGKSLRSKLVLKNVPPAYTLSWKAR
jgi:phospholipid N-methyltransferase